MATDASVSAGAAGRDPEVPDSAWSTLPWYKTGVGLVVVGFDVALTIGLALGTTGLFDSVIPTLSSGALGVPLGIYAFCLMGALGYVFTTLVEQFDSETHRVLRYNLRLPAALPLGAGIYVLSEVILGSTPSQALVYGLVFLSGLYVNLAYKRLGALARRLLPKNQRTGSASGNRSAESSTTTQSDSKPSDPSTSRSGDAVTDGTGAKQSDREAVSVSQTPENEDGTSEERSTAPDTDPRNPSGESPNPSADSPKPS